MTGLLEGRVAVVTGGGGGIGRGVVERFVAEGATIALVEHDRDRAADVERAVRDAGGEVRAVVGDVREAAVVEELFVVAEAELGPVDVLVNNVGHYGGPRGTFHEQTDEEWLDLYRVNLEHVMRCTRRALGPMVQRGAGGSIVTLSTVEAFRAIPTRAAYSAFKGAITALTRSLAVEYGRHRIRVNAVAPDVTETLQVPYSRWLSSDDERLIPTWVPLGRLGRPDDVAGAVLFLASDLAAFVTGTTVHTDGGTLAAGGWFPTEEGGWTNRPRRP